MMILNEIIYIFFFKKKRVKRGERGYKTLLSQLPPPQTLTHFLLLTCPAPPFPNPRSEKLLLFSHGCGALLFGTKPTLQPPRHHWSNSRKNQMMKNPLSAPSSPPQEFTDTRRLAMAVDVWVQTTHMKKTPPFRRTKHGFRVCSFIWRQSECQQLINQPSAVRLVSRTRSTRHIGDDASPARAATAGLPASSWGGLSRSATTRVFRRRKRRKVVFVGGVWHPRAALRDVSDWFR